MDVTKKIIYEGMHVAIKAKREFMLYALETDAVKEYLAKMLMEGQITDKLNVMEMPIVGGRYKKLTVNEEELEYLFDEVIGKNLSLFGKDNLSDSNYQMLLRLTRMFVQNGKEKWLDVTNYLTYAVIVSEDCLKQMYCEIEQAGLYDDICNCFLQSAYNEQSFEEMIDAKRVAASRLFRGLLVKFRQEKSVDMYNMIMRVIYAGYRKIKKDLKRIGVLDGTVIRDIHRPWWTQQKSAIYDVCIQAVIYVVADDLDIKIKWDFELLEMVDMVIHFSDEFSGEKRIVEEIPAQLTSEQTEQLEKVEKKYGTKASVTDMIYGVDGEQDTLYLLKIMNAFHVCSRKFQEYELTEKEIIALMAQKERWNTKDYMYCMVLAILCKYIYSLERVVAESDLHENAKRIREVEKQWEKVQNEKALILSEQKKIKEKESVHNKSLLEQERRVEQMVKQIEEQQNKMVVYEQELAELRNYVYGLQEEREKDITNEMEDMKAFWKGKKVLVIGGHSRWQQKLKEQFPKWQFLSMDSRNLSAELVRDKEYIVCNTEILSHATYYKLLAERGKSQKILYVHSNNMDLCLRELYMQR